MKKLSIILLLIILTSLYYLANPEAIEIKRIEDVAIANNVIDSTVSTNYYMDVELLPDEKELIVQQKIVWKNLSNTPIDEIYLNLYPNTFSNKKTFLAKTLDMESENFTRFEFNKILVDNNPANLEYFFPTSKLNDSTCAKIKLNKFVTFNDSVELTFNYKLKIPLALNRFGYASGRNFFLISEWYPKISHYKNGEWKIYPYYPYTNFYSESSGYNVKVTIPDNYKIFAGKYFRYENHSGTSVYEYNQKGSKDFTFAISDDITLKEGVFVTADSTDIKINLAVQPEHEKYFDRYFTAINNSIEWLSKNIGVFPGKSVTLVDLPKSGKFGNHSYNNLFTISTELFLPDDNYNLELHVAHKLAMQYFYQTINSDALKSGWLSEGLSEYVASKIVTEYYGEGFLTFNLAQYVPIYGLNFHSYNEIPIIYALSDAINPEGTDALIGIYNEGENISISESSYKLSKKEGYLSAAKYRPYIMLLTMERFFGYKNVKNILKHFYDSCNGQVITSEDFWIVANSVISDDISWFKDNIYENAFKMDYRVSSIDQVDSNKYEVLVENIGEGYFRNDVALITSSDTLWAKYDSNDKWKIFTFETSDEVIGAEVDPYRKNLFDSNFSNNSYTSDIRIWGALSLSLRWFFWVQNALMVLGSAG